MKKKEDKLSALEHYLRRFGVTCDLYPFLRLLLPGIDHERGAYGLKESQLAKLFGEMLGLPEVQRQRLLHWKDPALQEGYKCAAGDFASVLYSVVETRASVKPGASALTIGELNAALDRIHNAPDVAEKRAQLLGIARRASAMEQKWIAKIVLKDLKVGFSHESVLKRFHPDAMELYNRSSMLKQVLDEIRAQYVRAQAAGGGGADSAGSAPGAGTGFSGFSAPAAEPLLFSKFKPMLAQRLPMEKLATLFSEGEPPPQFAVEAKYDGERILAHIDRDAKRVELYTRNAIDYTGLYAPSMRSVLLAGLVGRQAVLDGEMLSWDEAEQAFVPFGSNRTVAAGADPNRHLCYVAFDILAYTDADGQRFDLRRTRLLGRRELLERVVAPKERWLEVAPQLVTGNFADVQNRLEGIMDFRQEGIILKEVDSKYFFNARKRGWYKVKPEYEEGLSETLDLLVIGAFFGDSSRRRAGNGLSTDLADNCSQFLLAAKKANGTEGEDVVTVARVGTGFNMVQLKEMRDRLRPHLRRYDQHRAPSWLGGWRGAGKSKPDALIDSPRHCFVMEVKAAEIIPSDDYELGHTLRFPRAVTPVRADKDWCDANTEEDLREFLRSGRGNLTSRKLKAKVEVESDGGEETDDGAQEKGGGGKRRRKGSGKGGKGAVGAAPLRAGLGLRRGASFGVLDGFREADTTHVPVASQMLKGAEVFVINGDAQYSKGDLELYVVQHGGRCVQNYIRGRTSMVIAASMGDLRAKNLAKTAQVDIVKYAYLFHCENSGRVLPLRPKDLLVKGPETKERFAAAFDELGDAYYVPVASADELRETLAAIPRERAEAVPEEVVDALARHPRFAAPTAADGDFLPSAPDDADGGEAKAEPARRW